MLNSLRNVSGGKYGRGRGRIIMEGQPRRRVALSKNDVDSSTNDV